MKTLLSIIFLLFAISAQSQDLDYKISQAVFVASATADFVSTATLPPGYSEGNPILGKSKPRIAVTMGAFTALSLWSAHRIHKKYQYDLAIAEKYAKEGNLEKALEWGEGAKECKKWSKIGLWIGSVVHIGAATYNFTR